MSSQRNGGSETADATANDDDIVRPALIFCHVKDIDGGLTVSKEKWEMDEMQRGRKFF